IFVQEDVDLDKTTSSLKNGGSASRIYLEVHGNGITNSISTFSFIIANGASNSSSWIGTVWAPYAAINVGSGTGSSNLTGSFWSATQVKIQSGVNITFAQYNPPIGDTLIVPGYQPPPLGKSTDIIGPELTSLCQTFGTGIIPSPDIYRIIDSSVLIEVVAKDGHYNDVLSILQNQYGMTNFVDNGPNSLIITGQIPINQLCNINNDSTLKNSINSCRPVYPPITSTGLANTGGDTSVGSYIVRNAFHLTGEGIKVGIISDGYNTIPGSPDTIDILNGDLPGVGNPDGDSTPVDVLLDYPYGRSSDEGRAMMQVVHDIAPKSSLAFRTGFISEGDFAQGINQLQQAGCKVIADDITYITTPFFKDGLAAKAVNNVKAAGVSYFSAAGNFGTKSYEAIFNPTAAPAGITGEAHNFGSGDILQNDSLQAGSYTIVLQWQDSIYSLGQGGALNDFDIYLTNDDGSILFGMNRPNIGADPIEVLPFIVRANTRTNIMIVRAAGNTPNVRLKFIVYRGDLKFNEFSTGTSTLVGQANAQGAMAVAAARYTLTPAYGVTPAMNETFSSPGGTPVYGVVRNKPDFTAPDGGNSSVNFSSLDLEHDGIPNFFGTSAAAPHAAGVAALILQGKKLFYNKELEPDSVRIVLSNTALDMSTPGFDYTSGYGLIQADAAISSFAAPTPELDSLITSTDSSLIGKTNFTVTLKGKYFQLNTVVRVRGVAVTTTILNSSQATAVIPPFSGNPPIQMFTTPKTPSGLDGLYSNPLYFFSHNKKKIVITADNKTKKYGEKLPTFTSTILVDNVPLDSTGLSLADLQLDTIAYTTPATSSSNVGLYFIKPSFKPLSAIDSLVFELYDYTFNNGILFNNKMPLLVTPKDTAFTYGDKIGGFNFNYTYGDSLIAVPERGSFLTNIGIAHDSTIDTSVVAFVDGKTIINGETLTDADLLNMSVMASGKSIINARNIINGKTIKNGIEVTDTTKVIDLALQSILNYQADSSSSQLVNGRTIVNGKSIINGTAEVNGKTIKNGTTILNSNSVGDTSNNNIVVIIDQDDVTAETNTLSDIRSVNMITGITAGDFRTVPAAMLSENFETRYALGDLKILPASLSVKANDTAIYQGDSIPKFTSTITGLRNGDSVISGPTYTLSPTCVGNAGTYKIIPSNLVVSSQESYVTTYTPGTLYINPKGKHAKNLKPYLVCVDVLNNDPSGLKYVATFGCNNPNATTVFVSRGPDNYLSGTGSASAVGTLPQVFKPGDSTTFQIKFNGKKIIWTLKSYYVNQKTAVAQDASSTSQRCKASSQSIASATINKLNSTKAIVTPNPTHSRCIISINKGIISGKDIFLTDMTGKKYSELSVNTLSSTKLEINLPAYLASGVYYISVKINNDYKVLRIIKM
ncbi:MAG TPA: MBG domain-containing protein, partial [Parafilimonas sp.]|nr:MBG domain-containing protein [Parafilimonas sp.]